MSLEPHGIVLKSSFRFTIDHEQMTEPAPRRETLRRFLRDLPWIVRYRDGRLLRYYWKVWKTRRRMRGVLYNAGV